MRPSLARFPGVGAESGPTARSRGSTQLWPPAAWTRPCWVSRSPRLRRYPLDVIKIDRSFVTDITTDKHARAITVAVVALANALGVTVTAEGVEHPDQAAILRDIGCPSAQGWLYSKAVPADQATDLLDHTYPNG